MPKRSVSTCRSLFTLFCSLVAAACQPELALHDGAGGGGGSGSGGGMSVSFAIEPAAEPGEAPRALRIHVRPSGAIDPSLGRFVRGDVGPGHLRQLALDDPSHALEERILPASVWTEDGEVIVAPHALLAPDERYAVAVPDCAETLDLRTLAADAAPILPRIWPPLEGLAAEPLLVFCGDDELDFVAIETRLAPDGRAAAMEAGARSDGVGRRCVHLRARDRAPDGTVLMPPPAIDVAGTMVGLEPSPLVIGNPEIAPAPPLACEPSEVPFGTGCASISDDRAVVRTPDEPRLWIVGGPGVDLVVSTAPGEPFAVHPLAVASAFELGVESLDAAGRAETATVTGRTSSAAPHVVLNEVLANAVGPEPASEWLEILNDGALVVNLGGYVVTDLGGEVALPDVDLAPGEIALLVGEGWTGDGLDDVAPPSDALVLHVPRVGRSGIANGGEPLRLRDPSGAIVSTIPAIDAPDPGMSAARREPWLADAPSSFVSTVPTPGSPNDVQ